MQSRRQAVAEAFTQLSEVEAGAGGRGEAGAGGERGVAGRVLQAAGGVGAQPVTGLLVASQLWGRAVPAGRRGRRSGGGKEAEQNKTTVFLENDPNSDCVFRFSTARCVLFP